MNIHLTALIFFFCFCVANESSTILTKILAIVAIVIFEWTIHWNDFLNVNVSTHNLKFIGLAVNGAVKPQEPLEYPLAEVQEVLHLESVTTDANLLVVKIAHAIV